MSAEIPEPVDGTIVAWFDQNGDLFAVFHRNDAHKEWDGDRDTWFNADQFAGIDGRPLSWRELLAEMDGNRGPSELVSRGRISALVAQQPVQARDVSRTGFPLWIHPCGSVTPFREPPNGEAHHVYPPCKTPGPWRPLLVGGDPAPESAEPDAEWLRDELEACSTALRSSRDLMAQVMAELGVDRPENVLPALKSGILVHARRAFVERDEARAEVERLHAARDQMQANAEMWQQDATHWRENCARLNELIEGLKAAQPDPLVLSLPEGAVALVGVESGRRYLRRAPFIWEPDEADSTLHGLQQVLEREGSVRVEMAPPREPRTWPKLDSAPSDLKLFRGASGEVYMPWTTLDGKSTGEYLPRSKYDSGEKMLSFHTHRLSHWREVDGPLTEVLDEPDGAA